MSRFNADLLHALAAVLDDECYDIMKEFRGAGTEPDTRHMLVRLFDDEHAGDDLADVVVARGTMAAQVESEEDLEERFVEVTRVMNAWIDGFVIGVRYAAEQAKPKPPKSLRNV